MPKVRRRRSAGSHSFLPPGPFPHKLPLMSSETPQARRSVLLSFRFLFTAIAGAVVMALVSAFGPLPAQIAMLGAFISILGGIFLGYIGQEEQREHDRAAAIESLAVPLALASDAELFKRYQEIASALTGLAQHTDPILRRIAMLKLASVSEQMDGLAAGKIVFALTESWRNVYEEILKSPDVKTYRSIAWVRSPKYWQDEPGRQSMTANFEAVSRGVLVERVVLLKDELWPAGHRLPVADIWSWIEEQHNHGVWIALARESDLSRETDLLADMGIYGDRAVGTQELDDACRTLRFTLDLDPQSVELADSKWKRLQLYARPLRSILDQGKPGR